MDITRINYTVDTCSIPSIEFYENLWTIIHDAMSILVVQNDPGFVSNYWVQEYLLPTPAFPCCVFDSISALKTQKRKMIWCKRQIITPYNCQPWPPMTWRQDALKDFINWTCQMRRVPGNFWGPRRMSGFLFSKTNSPTAMHKWLDFCVSFLGPWCVWIHDFVETSTFIETEDSLAGNEWLERPSVFPACMVQTPNREQIGSFLRELNPVDISTIFQMKGRLCGRCQHPFLQVLRRLFPYMAGAPCCTLAVDF